MGLEGHLSFFVQFIKNGKKQICSDMSEHMFLLYDLSVNKFRKIYNRKNKGEHTNDERQINAYGIKRKT